MTEPRKFVLARSCQWMLYAGSFGLLTSVSFGLDDRWIDASFAAALAAALAIIASPFVLSCSECGAAYFDVIPSLSDGMIGRWKKQFAIWRPVPRLCQSCGLDRI